MFEVDRDALGIRPRQGFSQRLQRARKALTTREGLIGTYDYAFLFRPNIPFLKRPRKPSPFFGLHDPLPTVLALLLGFQHALAMLAGVVTPPIMMGGATGVNLALADQQYLVSTSLIVSGIMSAVQITRFHIWKTPYFVGTGMISVVGTSFAFIPVATGAFNQMYATGFCPLDDEGNRLPCPDGYGALLGTCALCALIEIMISFLPPRVIRRIFPPLVTGPVVILIGVYLIRSGFRNWAGGSNSCFNQPETGLYRLCPTINAPRPMVWGSANFVGLGFLVFITIILCERFGSPIMQSTSVILGLLMGCIVASATGYFDDSGIAAAPAASFIWVRTFNLSIYGPLVLPLLMVFVICACEAIGDITATSDVSRLEVTGRLFESRVQGGILADGLNGIVAPLATITPMATFSQNNGVIALTRCANRKAGYCCCFFLILAGIFAKFSAALVAIPPAVLGGMTTFLFAAVMAAGFAILCRVPFNRRTRFVVTASMALGMGATVVPGWFSNVFTYDGDNSGLSGFYSAITLVMETGFAVAALVGVLLNLTLPEEIEEFDEQEDIAAAGAKPNSTSSLDEPHPKDEGSDFAHSAPRHVKDDEEAWTTSRAEPEIQGKPAA